MKLTSYTMICNRLMQKSLWNSSLNHVKSINALNLSTKTSFKEDVNLNLMNSLNADIKNGGVVPVFRKALLFPSRVALQDDMGVYTYAGLHQAATKLCSEISSMLNDQTGLTVSYMCSNNASHVVIQWAIWMSGNVAVPLTPLHPEDMLKYFIMDSQSELIICTQEYEKTLKPITSELSKKLLVRNKGNEVSAQLLTDILGKEGCQDSGLSNKWYGDSNAMLIYTSGTTSKPKGVVWTHRMLSTQIASLHNAWRYSANDVVLHTLPLHHIHGQLNSLNATLAAGAKIRMLPQFVSPTVWSRLLSIGEPVDSKINVFHGVPAMYARLASDHEHMFADARSRQYVRDTLSKMRLMCAGSAPLPETLANKWYEISGQRLLERYGMSEVGMALSNPYRPVEDRTVGSVGQPLPGIEARVAEEVDGKMSPIMTVTVPESSQLINLKALGLIQTQSEPNIDYEWKQPQITIHKENTPNQGELLLKGPGIFKSYFHRKTDDFTEDGWFRTGDIVSFTDKFKILGRKSVDIIKTGGYKVSALHVESVILEIDTVTDAAVIGVDDEMYGEMVAAVLVLKPDAKLSLKDLKEITGKKLAPYQLPKIMLIVDQIPRNVMGKLDKKLIKTLYGKKLTVLKE